MSSAPEPSERRLPPLGVALVGSNALAVVAELIAATRGYEDFVAIRRRGNATNLPVIMDSDAWNDKILRRPGYFKAHEKIQEFDDLITKLVGGRRFDAFVHISKDIFCQMLASHPLCDRYFYMEEGITSMLGKRFGKARTRKLQPFIWKWRSKLFYGDRFNIFHPHFVTDSPKYGGAYAISECAFPDFPNKVMLSLNDLPAGDVLEQDVVVFLDTHYAAKNIEEEYKAAMKACLSNLIDKPSTVAVKFHPRDTDPVRHERMLDAVRSVANVTGVVELPSSFVGERMIARHPVKAVVGLSGIGMYLSRIGFPVYTFGHRLPSIKGLYDALPAHFHETCEPA